MDSRFEVIVAGEVQAPVLKLSAPVSFWGGVDQFTGTIIDRSHPECGADVSGKVLMVPMIKGSGGTPGSLATLIKLGKAPAGIVLNHLCPNVMAAALIGQQLYGETCPVFLATAEQSQGLDGAALKICSDGEFTPV